MAVRNNNFDSGTHNAVISVANSGGGTNGDALDILLLNNASVPSGNVAMGRYSTAAAAQGALGVELILQAGPSYLRWNPTETGFNRYCARRAFYVHSTPSAAITLMTMSNGTLVNFQLDTSRRISVQIGGSFVTGSLSTALPASAWYFLEAACTKETGGGSNGQIEYKVTDITETLVGTVYASAADKVLGSGDYTQYRFGGGTTASGWTNDWIDSIRGGQVAGTDTWLGGFANAAPTVSGAVTTANPAPVSTLTTITYTAADSDGTIASRATTMLYPESSPPSITDGTTSTPDFTTSGTAPALYVQRQTVTDNGGASTPSDPVEVYVEGSGTITTLPGTSAYVQETVGSAWTQIGGGANSGATLSDGSGTTLIESPDITTTEQVHWVRLAPMTARTTPRITLLGALLTSGTANINKIRVRAGTTQITERATTTLKKVSDNSTSDITTSSQDLYFDLTSGEVTAINAVTNGRDRLWVGFVVDLS